MAKRPTKEERMARTRWRLAIDYLELAVRRIKHAVEGDPTAIEAALANADEKLGDLRELVGREPLRSQDGREISGAAEVPTASPTGIPEGDPDFEVKEDDGRPF